jgi:hypothetical protein
MSFTGLAGLGGIGFVLVGIAINIVYVRARLPLPVSGRSLDEVTDDFATVGDALKRPSVLAPATWLFLTLFAAGLLAVLWRDGPGTGAWALVGFAGVLMQNVTFTCVEALRFGMASAAVRDRVSVAELWGLGNVPVRYQRAADAVTIGVQLPAAKTWWRNFTGTGGPISLQLDGIDCTGHAVARRDASGHVTVTVRLNAPQRTP